MPSLKLPEEQLKLLHRGEWWLKYSRKLKLDKRSAMRIHTASRSYKLRTLCRLFKLSSDGSELFWLHKNAKRTAATSMRFDAMRHILYGPAAFEELQKTMQMLLPKGILKQVDTDLQSHLPKGVSAECLV
jgi:hypothetical protein